MLTKLLKAGQPSRRSRFHTARNELPGASAWMNLPISLGTFVLLHLFGYRPAVPWISASGRRAIAKLLPPRASALEVGAGMSTLWLARRCAQLVSIEADENWFKRMQEKLRQSGCAHVDLRFRWVAGEMFDFHEFPDGSLDFVLVDGGPREECVLAAMPKLRPGGAIYVDNTDEPSICGGCRERLLQIAALTGADLRVFRDFAPATLFATEGILLITPKQPAPPR